jgi:hypothetical protein
VTLAAHYPTARDVVRFKDGQYQVLWQLGGDADGIALEMVGVDDPERVRACVAAWRVVKIPRPAKRLAIEYGPDLSAPGRECAVLVRVDGVRIIVGVR